jgi:hypothetical protein
MLCLYQWVVTATHLHLCNLKAIVLIYNLLHNAFQRDAPVRHCCNALLLLPWCCWGAKRCGA